MRVKNLYYEFAEIDKEEIKLLKMAAKQIKSSQQLLQTDERDITLKKENIFSTVQGNAFCFSFWNNNKHSS